MSSHPSTDYVRMGYEADVVLRLGMMLMGAGTSGYRVLRGMKRAARALGFDRLVMLATGAARIDDVQWTPVP